MNKISLIIPVYNEAKTIGNLLSYLKSNAESRETLEIILVDGGSTDHTLKEIKKYPEVICVIASKGRAVQMNIGVKRATGELLYFLHADSYPPKAFDRLIRQAYQQGYKAGCFRMKFDSRHIVLSTSAWFTRFNKVSCRGGDQSLFVDRELFEELEGYDESFVVYEDVEFIKRLYERVRFRVIPEYLVTSSRRYQNNGVWKLQYHFTIIHLKKWLGASPSDLLEYYKRNVAS